ncbi:MAG: hypothetical protein JRH11_10680 [Deltaproteobacteria bacterium]|nr:hypothetical protein [Deltaproteobacteria bacterium]
MKYRSAGGGDEGDNVLSVCAACHLEGEHGGRLKVRVSKKAERRRRRRGAGLLTRPPAGKPRWELGRRGQTPVMVVEGRERLAG